MHTVTQSHTPSKFWITLPKPIACIGNAYSQNEYFKNWLASYILYWVHTWQRKHGRLDVCTWIHSVLFCTCILIVYLMVQLPKWRCTWSQNSMKDERWKVKGETIHFAEAIVRDFQLVFDLWTVLLTTTSKISHFVHILTASTHQ